MKRTLHVFSVSIGYALMFLFFLSASAQNGPVGWNGSVNNSWTTAANWSPPVVPDATSDVTILMAANQPVISGDAAVKSLTMIGSTTLTVQSGSDLTVTDALVTDTQSILTLENNANLLQVSDVVNTGKITVKRNSSALKLQDYTLWSSPVAMQNLVAFSPLTLSNRFYTYNPSTNVYDVVPSPSGKNFYDAKGYLIRMPNNHPTTPTIWNGQFTGEPHNGEYVIMMYNGGPGKQFNLVGNPYPSPISMDSFVADNSDNITGALYFWRKTNNAASPSYCSWTPLGGFVSNGEAQVTDPAGIIQTGQGFFVEAKDAATTVAFKNTQRTGNNAGQFFRTASVVEKNRIWLNATNSAGAYSQMLLGYISGATTGVDENIDGKYINDGAIALNSIVGTADYVIQGRPLPFDASDVVPLRFKAATAGNYSIAIDHLDGLFAGSQDIFLKDNLNGIIHNLKTGAYNFASAAGNFTGRFEVLYQSQLSIAAPEFDNQVVVYQQDGAFVINSGAAVMDRVQVFGLRGMLLFDQKGINGSEFSFHVGGNEMLFVKITSNTNAVITKKVMQ